MLWQKQRNNSLWAVLLVLLLFGGCGTEKVRVDRPPRAFAGFDQEIYVGGSFVLDGTGSEDPEEDPLSYQWSLITAPLKKVVTAEGKPWKEVVQQPVVRLQATQPGLYLFSLKVRAGQQESLPDLVAISVLSGLSSQTPPVVLARENRVLLYSKQKISLEATLVQEKSQATVSWRLFAGEGNKNIQLDSASSLKPTFVAPGPGSWTFAVQAEKEGQKGLTDFMTVHVLPSTEKIAAYPVARIGPLPQKTGSGDPRYLKVGDTMSLDGSKSTAGKGAQLQAFRWSLVQLPPESKRSATSLQTKGQKASFVPDAPGSYLVRLVVIDDATPKNRASAPDYLSLQVSP